MVRRLAHQWACIGHVAGEGKCGVAQVVDRQVRAAGSLAGRAVAVHEVSDAHVIRAVAREEESVWSRGAVLEQMLLEHRQERRG